jgi:hypothetical protein
MSLKKPAAIAVKEEAGSPAASRRCSNASSDGKKGMPHALTPTPRLRRDLLKAR